MQSAARNPKNKEEKMTLAVNSDTKEQLKLPVVAGAQDGGAAANVSIPADTKTFTSIKKKKFMIRSADHLKCTWSNILNVFTKFFALQYFERPPVSLHSNRIVPRIMLHGCANADEHYERIKNAIKNAKNRSSLEGLEAVGFTYKFTPCDGHSNETCTREKYGSTTCPCGTWLVYSASKTLITKQNRLRYIADGDMYEVIVRLCQEYAQELIMTEASLHWVSVCEDRQKGNPIRILVDQDFPIHYEECNGDCDGVDGDGGDVAHGSMHNNIEAPRTLEYDNENTVKTTGETFLITTGKGKVRAGIFSRQHLLVSSIEASTALPMVRDAKRRNMRIAILDPNARGDRYGMATYEQSMRVLFGSTATLSSTNDADNAGPINILAHSASGAQLTRYLQTEGSHLLTRIQSIAFTDSNHSIQWLKDHSQILSFFESSATIYIRSSNEDRDDGWECHKTGDLVDTARDENWTHRFGQTLTIWAGTTDHSLTNFTSHSHIWAHFDRHRKEDSELNERCNNDTKQS